ncbi:hypothetical protein CAP35_06620 [Chitinophagaceae bacterium IBVUCB1]|nr:hypothetical protein CAP35_06620 [Chitinophagaceae bacterium IBVUCB1]
MYIPKTNFYLKNINSQEPTLISLQVKFNGHRVFMSTGEKVLPKQWDYVKQRAIGKEHGDLNYWLNKIDSELASIFRNLNIENIIPSAELVIELLKEKLDNTPQVVKEAPVKITFVKFIEQFIEQSKSVRKEETLKGYRTTLNHLRDYAKHYSCKIEFENIDMDFYHQFTKYLSVDIGNSKNTVSKHIKTIKTFMNEATERGYNTNMIFKSRSFKKVTETVDKIYLSQDEIQYIYELVLPNVRVMNIARDLFVISCYTGLRFSDFIHIKPEDIKDNVFHIRTKKTDQYVVIPINKIVKQILEKYQYNLPTICNVKMNHYLKEIGKLAGIDTPVVITKTIGGRRVQTTFKKYELISAHCGRRSFATNAYKSNIPAISIMKITGHTSEKAFLGYIRISQEENAELLMQHDFFI